MNYNVVYAQMGRGKMERNVAFALASIAGTVSKLAFDVMLEQKKARAAEKAVLDKERKKAYNNKKKK